MSRDIGPEMLAHLEARRSTMTDGEYVSRRIEIEELIRRGKAIEYSAVDQIGRTVTLVAGLLLGLVLLAQSGASGSIGAGVFGLAIIVGSVWLVRRWGRR